MKKETILSSIIEIGIVPVVRAPSADGAYKAIEAIYNGGIRAAEVTMTVPGAVKVLEKLADQFGIKNRAGAQFFVTPALNPQTIEVARRYSKPIMPGALTPTEVLAAWQAGADIVKVFPCDNVGGAKYIKALKGPFPQIELIPTGGVSLTTAGDFLKAGACAVAVGGELVDAKTIKEGKFEVFEERARQFLEVIRKAREEMKAA